MLDQGPLNVMSHLILFRFPIIQLMLCDVISSPGMSTTFAARLGTLVENRPMSQFYHWDTLDIHQSGYYRGMNYLVSMLSYFQIMLERTTTYTTNLQFKGKGAMSSHPFIQYSSRKTYSKETCSSC